MSDEKQIRLYFSLPEDYPYFSPRFSGQRNLLEHPAFYHSELYGYTGRYLFGKKLYVSLGNYNSDMYFKVSGDLRALKRHHPELFSCLKTKGLLLKKRGRKWSEQ